jgi:hypothetical protein
MLQEVLAECNRKVYCQTNSLVCYMIRHICCCDVTFTKTLSSATTAVSATTIELAVADSRQGLGLQLVMKYYTEPWN